MTEKIEAYWFARSDRLPHGDGREIIIGKKHSLRGNIVICKHALHASREPFDALRYAPGSFLYKVRCWGDVVEHNDKLGARHREYVAMRDATAMLWQSAREQALSVINLWDAPEVVVEYLKTGNKELRAVAENTAYASVIEARNESAARSAARAAAAGDAAFAPCASWNAFWNAAEARRETGSEALSAARNRFNELVAELFAEVGNA